MFCAITELATRLENEQLDAKIVLTLHDELVVDVAEERAPRCAVLTWVAIFKALIILVVLFK